jgi:ABC-type multidrug transport system ATPase subunit
VLTVVLGAGGAGSVEPSSGAVERSVESFACAPQTAAFADQHTVAANVDLVRALRQQDPAAVGDLLARLGLDELEGRQAGALSGGERQRLAVARAVAVDADVVVLDEPTSQLDRASARLVAAVVRDSARSGACVLCASHDEEIIAVADQIVDLGAARAPSRLLASSKG